MGALPRPSSLPTSTCDSSMPGSPASVSVCTPVASTQLTCRVGCGGKRSGEKHGEGDGARQRLTSAECAAQHSC
jgi:hypothetical protein